MSYLSKILQKGREWPLYLDPSRESLPSREESPCQALGAVVAGCGVYQIPRRPVRKEQNRVSEGREDEAWR